ncbi:MAG: hypothetical protein WA999_00580 [Spirulinaceae cyanobacterium]
MKEINHVYPKPRQTPYAKVEPANKYHLILLPKEATEQDIAALWTDAFEAEADRSRNCRVGKNPSSCRLNQFCQVCPPSLR